MNTKNNSSDSFLDQIGLGGLIIVALLVLTLVVATSRGIPKMERDLQGRSTAALQAIGVETSPDSLHFEGRDAHLVLPAESAMDEQVVAEKLREVRGVRRVFLVREDDGEIMAPGEPTEDGDEKRAPVAVTAEQESAAIEGAKLGLADVGDGKGAAVESTPAATTRDEAAIKEEAIKEELSVATRTGGSSATEEERPEVPHEIALEPTAHVPGVSDGPVEIQPSASTDVATNQTGISGATGAQPARDESVDASPSMATSAEPVAQQASDVGTRRSTSVSPPRAAPSVTTEQTGTHAGSAAGEAVVQSPVESASGGQWKSGDESIAGESTGDKSAVDGSITDKVMSQARNGVRMISDEARNAGTVAGQGGQAADAAEIAGAQGEQPSGFGAGQEAAKEPALGVAQEPRLNLEFDPAGIRVSGRVADQQAVQQVEETLRSAAKRDISFALSTGSARGSMPWLTGAAEVVAGLRPDDHGRMTMSEGGGVGIQIPPGSISQASAITERLK
ncbi:MAG: hypothetical protein U9Q71_10690, partial [Pseudomonadota bacterium]|nr:hypothetical protein [Pseudomonadota bacterium]